nr:hypothetical protein [Tanacetum cinerariifolium]
MPPRVRTQSAGRPIAESRGGGTGERVRRGGRGRGPRGGNDEHVDEFNGQGNDQGERLINLVENDNSDSSNDPLLEEANLFLDDNSIPPGIENFAYGPEGDICFLEELLIDDSILSHELFDSNFKDNPSIPRPPPKPPDVETDVGEEIQVVMIDKNKFDDDS